MIAALFLMALGQAQACPASVTLPAQMEIPLATVEPLTSKKQVKGDMVALVTTDDVLVNGAVAIPKGTAATGQVSDARATGGLGINGRLVVAPLYLRTGGAVVRLEGATLKSGHTGADSVAGLAFTPIVSGKSAKMAAGSSIPAQVLHAVTICPASGG